MDNYVNTGIISDFEYTISSRVNSQELRQIIDELKNTGFFRDDGINTSLVVRRMIELNEIFVDETRRVGFLDAEEIDEGQCAKEIKNLLQELELLKIYGDLNISGEYQDSTFTLAINNCRCKLWDYNEREYKKKPWKLVVSRVIRMLNDFLAYRNTGAMLIYEYASNDSICLLLSNEMVSIFMKYGVLSKCETSGVALAENAERDNDSTDKNG